MDQLHLSPVSDLETFRRGSFGFFFSSFFLPLKSFRGTTRDLKRIGLAEHHRIDFGTKRWHPFHERRLLQHRLNRRIHFLFACAHAISAATSAFEDPHRRLHVVGASATLLHPPVLILLSSGISIKVCIFCFLSPSIVFLVFVGGARER